MPPEMDSDQVDLDDELESQSDNNLDQSDASEGQETIGDSFEDAEQLADKVRQNPAAREILRREFQSKKDQGVEQAKKATQEAEDKLDIARRALQAAGVDPNNIDSSLQQGVIGKMAEEYMKTGTIPTTPQSVPDDPGDTGELLGSKAVRTASRFVPPETPEDIRQKVLSKVRNGYFENTADLIAFTSQEVIRLQTKPKPNLASTQQKQGEVLDEPDEQTILQKKYQAELLNAQKTNQHRRIPDIKKKYRQQGLKI
jgi:hypothetical protein